VSGRGAVSAAVSQASGGVKGVGGAGVGAGEGIAGLDEGPPDAPGAGDAGEAPDAGDAVRSAVDSVASFCPTKNENSPTVTSLGVKPSARGRGPALR
jgi:hypothetical protein